MKIRLASHLDQKPIANLYQNQGLDLGDWEGIYPYWLVAEHEDRVVGALQIMHGRPAGRLEFLGLDPTLSHRRRAEAVYRLGHAGFEALRENGSTLASTSVRFEDKPFKKILRKHFGMKVTGQANLLLARL